MRLIPRSRSVGAGQQQSTIDKLDESARKAAVLDRLRLPQLRQDPIRSNDVDWVLLVDDLLWAPLRQLYSLLPASQSERNGWEDIITNEGAPPEQTAQSRMVIGVEMRDEDESDLGEDGVEVGSAEPAGELTERALSAVEENGRVGRWSQEGGADCERRISKSRDDQPGNKEVGEVKGRTVAILARQAAACPQSSHHHLRSLLIFIPHPPLSLRLLQSNSLPRCLHSLQELRQLLLHLLLELLRG